MNFIENASRNSTICKDGYILVNKVPVKSNYKVKSGDVVTIEYRNPPKENLDSS